MLTAKSLLPLLALTVGCGVLSKKEDRTQERTAFEERNDTGCVQGVIMNGQTGERLAITDKEADEEIFVLAHNSHLSASSADDADYLKGEYVLCGVPLDETFPIFARFHGFGDFYSHIQIESTLAQKSPDAEIDIRKPKPTRIANIRMYPIGLETQDLKVQVVHDGAAVENATVRLTPQGRSFFDDSNFLAPLNYRSQPMVVKTNAKGEAVFAKDVLMLGAAYKYDVLPPQGGAFQGAESGTLTVGLGRSDVNQPDPYSIVVNLADSREDELVVVSSSLDSADFDSRGRISLVFNRQIKIASDTEDKQSVFLNHAVVAKVKQVVLNNHQSEQVSVRVEGNTLVLEPIFQTIPDVSVDGGLEVTFSGIMVQVADSPNNTLRKDLGNLTVKVFGGTSQPIPFKVAEQLELTSGNAQAGTIGQTLSQPIKVRAYDQFGEPFSGQTIVFNVSSINNGGTLSAATAVTDSLGYAQVSWTLGNLVGTQSLTVSATSIHGTQLKNSPLTFTATASDLLNSTSLTIDSGDAQTAKISTALASPLKVRVLTSTGAAAAAKKVVFALGANASGGILSATTTTTDSSGYAQTAFTLGSTVGAQTVTASLYNDAGAIIATVTFTATATP